MTRTTRLRKIKWTSASELSLLHRSIYLVPFVT